MASPVVDQSLAGSGRRFSKWARDNESACKLAGGVLFAVVGATAWISDLLLEEAIAAHQLATEGAIANGKGSAANELAIVKGTAADQLAVKDAELRMMRRILDYAFLGKPPPSV